MYAQQSNTNGLSNDEIRQAFREFDLDRNGYVGAAEIAHVLGSMNPPVKATDDEIDEMILMADTDGDGQVSFEEFLRLMQHLSGMPPQQGAVPRGGYAGGRGAGPQGAGYGNPMALNRGGYAQGSYAGAGPGAGMPTIPMGGMNQAPYGGYDPMMTSGVGGGYPGAHPGSGGVASAPGASPIGDLESFQRSQGLNTESLKEMYKRFLESDKDGSGRVDVNEFVRMLRVDRTPFVERLFAMFDSDRTGLIDVKEFIVGMSNVGSEAKDNKIQFAFSVYDLDGSGFIDASEMRKIIKATNMSTDKQVDRKVEWLMRQCDTDGDGNISFEEFTALSKKFPNIVFPAFNLAGSMAGLT
mmetsp:Transcript_7122/g.23830  ORF Transcript_7122/g.23830 Transcript_7122/m.23830 type:complete len:354 (-) Transcript_7122:62-1123(-)